jgi:hypothetical protein
MRGNSAPRVLQEAQKGSLGGLSVLTPAQTVDALGGVLWIRWMLSVQKTQKLDPPREGCVGRKYEAPAVLSEFSLHVTLTPVCVYGTAAVSAYNLRNKGFTLKYRPLRPGRDV